MKARSPVMMLAGLVIVLFQMFSATGILVNVVHPACKSSKQCYQAGTYCVPSTRRCAFCGWHGALSRNEGQVISNLEPGQDENGWVDCDFSAQEGVVGRTEFEYDKCLTPPNLTLVASCAQMQQS